MNQSISETHDSLNEKLYQLEETGPTALGPALLTSVAMAGEGSLGSQVILCTDGLANTGLGSLEEKKDDGEIGPTEQFYQQVAAYAKNKGVTVNVISIKGDECDLETIQPVYDQTGGEVNIVEPEELIQNFGNIFQSPVIATNVVIKAKLHKALEFRNE